MAALSSYENRPISTGVLLLGTSADPVRPGVPPTSVVVSYDESLARIKSFFRLAEGVHTLFLASSEGRLLNIIDIRRWASGTRQNSLTPRAFQPHARATLQHGEDALVDALAHAWTRRADRYSEIRGAASASKRHVEMYLVGG